MKKSIRKYISGLGAVLLITTFGIAVSKETRVAAANSTQGTKCIKSKTTGKCLKPTTNTQGKATKKIQAVGNEVRKPRRRNTRRARSGNVGGKKSKGTR